MGLGKIEQVQTNKHYLAINNGKIIIDRGNGQKESFGYVEGVLEGIYTQKRNFGGEEVTRWFVDLRDGTDIYSICLPYSSGVFKSIVLALASDEALSNATPIRIESYERNNFTKVAVYSDGTKLDWITKELPPLKEVKVGSKVIKDDSERMKFICNLCNTINGRVTKK